MCIQKLNNIRYVQLHEKQPSSLRNKSRTTSVEFQ